MAHSDEPETSDAAAQSSSEPGHPPKSDPTPETKTHSAERSERTPNTPSTTEPPGEPAGANTGGLLLTAALALGCGLGGSFVYNKFIAPKTSEAAADAGTSKDPRSTVPLPGLTELTDRVDQLTAKFHELTKRIDQSDKDDAANDVPALRVRVADLSDATNNLTPTLGKVDKLAARISELSNTVETLQGDVQTIQSHQGQTSHVSSATHPARDVGAPSASSGNSAPLPDVSRETGGTEKTDVHEDASGLARGGELFRKGKFADARKVFERLELSLPDDARVWYYAALADGFATRDWTKGAVELVEKGISREEAGTPERAKIDAEFKDLTSATGKDWLAAYRKRVGATQAAKER